MKAKDTLVDLVSLYHIIDIAKNLRPDLKEKRSSVFNDLQKKTKEKAINRMIFVRSWDCRSRD